jgi:hypothetical protein
MGIWVDEEISKTILISVPNKRGTLPKTIDNGQLTIDNEKKDYYKLRKQAGHTLLASCVPRLCPGLFLR